MLAKAVVGIGRDMVELIYSDEPVVECLDTELIDSESESRMGANKKLIITLQKFPYGIDLATISAAVRCRDSTLV